MTQTALMDSLSKRKSGVVELITYEIYKHITWYKFYVTVLIKNQNLLISGFVGRTCSRRRSRGTGRHQEEGDIRVSSVSAVGVVANAVKVQAARHRRERMRHHQRKPRSTNCSPALLGFELMIFHNGVNQRTGDDLVKISFYSKNVIGFRPYLETLFISPSWSGLHIVHKYSCITYLPDNTIMTTVTSIYTIPYHALWWTPK